MGALYPALPIAVVLAIFTLLARHALEMRTKQNYREMWGATSLSLLPAAIFLIFAISGDSSMLIRNLVLLPAGALLGACAFAYAGYVISDIKSPPSPPPSKPIISRTIVAQGGPTINTWNQSGGTNNIVVGPIRLAFDKAIGEELVQKLPRGKPITLQSIGSQRDQAVADEYQQFLQSRGINVAERHIIGMLVPPPDQKISILDMGQKVVVTIAPSVN